MWWWRQWTLAAVGVVKAAADVVGPAGGLSACARGATWGGGVVLALVVVELGVFRGCHRDVGP